MKRLVVLFLLLFASPALATTWFAGSGDTDFNAVSGGTTSSVWNTNADGTSGTYLDFASQPANGDVFVANGATIAIDANIGSESVTVTLTTEGTDYGGTDGGGFTVAVNSVGALTLYVNAVSGTTDCLTVSGAGSAGTELTIIGNATGGSASNADGMVLSHTGVGAIVAIIGNGTGGSTTNAQGIYMPSSNSTTNITGVCTGSSTAAAKGCVSGGSGVLNVTAPTAGGNACVGNATGGSYGCQSTSTGILTVTGSMEWGFRSAPADGSIAWTPTGKDFIKFVSGDDIYASAGLSSDSAGTNITAANTAANVKAGTYFVKKDDGVLTVGTASSGGGGAWGF